MPTKRAQEFLLRLQADRDLQVKVSAVEANSKEAMVDELARIASEAGFRLTHDELAATVKDESEVADSQLEHVVGGMTNLSSSPIETVPLATESEQEPTGVTPSHAYTVSGTFDVGGTSYVVLRNPWGSS